MNQASLHGLVYKLHVPLFALWALLHQIVALNAQTCYTPNSNAVDVWTPCNASAEVSYCCANDDYCLANGYCYAIHFEYVYRPSCTDQTWNDPSCPYYCADWDTSERYATVVEAYSGFWCCEGYNKTTRLCDTPTQGSSKPFKLANSGVIYDRTSGQNMPANILGQSSTTTTVTTTTVTHVSKATVTIFPASPQSNSHDLAIGLGVGIPLAVLLLLTTSLLLRQLQQQKKQSPKVAEVSDVAQNPPGYPVNYDPHSSEPRFAGYRANQVISHRDVPEIGDH